MPSEWSDGLKEGGEAEGAEEAGLSPNGNPSPYGGRERMGSEVGSGVHNGSSHIRQDLQYSSDSPGGLALWVRTKRRGGYGEGTSHSSTGGEILLVDIASRFTLQKLHGLVILLPDHASGLHFLALVRVHTTTAHRP